MNSRFRPSVNDISAHYTHPFPSQDGNRRSFIISTEPRRIPQNGVAPFRMESQTEIEVNWSGMSNEAIISFVGELFSNKGILGNNHFDGLFLSDK